MNHAEIPVAGRLTKVVADKVTKVFGATPALRGASLVLSPGVITVLSGANGAGKSTLLSILGTQLRPTRGKVGYFDEAGHALTRRQVRSQLGWVSHTSHCYAELSGRQNVELCAELYGVPKERYEQVRERIGLGKFAERPVGTLSRGQTQRVALARALIHEPRLLLLDEPWTGLDERSASVLEKIIQEEVERGTIVALVSHEPGLAARLGARRAHLEGGKVRQA